MTHRMARPFSPAIAGLTLAAGLMLETGAVQAHVTPPVVLVSDRDVVVRLLAGAQRFFAREVRLSAPERDAIRQQSGWSPEEDFHRFYLGRDAEGRLVAAAVFLTEYTVHGPMRVAVALGGDGRVKGAVVVELTEETYHWVKPLIDQDLAADYVGQDARGRFGLTERRLQATPEAMPRFYAQVVATLIQRAAVLFEVGMVKRGDAT